ncbi:MAG: hypothetical protein COY69_02260 [Candidatus Magasanikbacteria bacterium CG_4_10_14_0_8_um_filter_32_14]|uniref:Baseplate protein J-like domain-containing protein n=2 Tax=Candidatus Magasanikiibacteriota TaxID=1752731 RepID=A0A2M7RAE1_9BACT|nr:MAG: hypothetical protein AUJ23_02950 [Candidatus Magasanikbacteria bacterium CG1_02_32_51]PIY93326.1 MAG: hypothetical protein COY69_02260 [Candidatus Magasanikbacteria bacterium CG_4_10_14_0_8_um_filter_32_14]
MVSTKKTFVSPCNQPVRFYKFVALTFLIVTIVLLGSIIFMSSKRAQITIITKAESVEVNTTVDIDPSQTDAIVSGFVTSTFVELTKVYSPQGNKTEEDLATGEVTLINDSNLPQILVIKTRLLSQAGILFHLKEGVVVPANGQIKAQVYADQKGESGNITTSTFTIPGLNETKQKIIYAKSATPMTGGIKTIGIFGQEDLTKAEQSLLIDLKKQGSDSLSQNNSEQKGLFDIVQYTFEHDGTLGEETSSFNLSGKATVIGVFYDDVKLKKYAQDMLEKHIVDNSEVLQSANEEPTVVLSQYNFQAGTAKLTVTNSGLVDLDPNSRELQKIMFFGKTEDEVRRYVMALDHVSSIEMNFHPAWNREVPNVASRVDIILRQIQ